MIRVGITGGVGAGKSIVCKIFALYNVPILIADDVAKKLMISDLEIIEFLKNEFGEQAFQGRSLNKEFLTKCIFENPEKRLKVNAIVHPKVKEYTQLWQQKHHADRYTIKEAAIVIENEEYKNIDILIGVFCPMSIRKANLKNHRGYSDAKIESIMAAQVSDEQLKPFCKYIIQNDGMTSVLLQVEQIHQNILNQAKV